MSEYIGQFPEVKFDFGYLMDHHGESIKGVKFTIRGGRSGEGHAMGAEPFFSITLVKNSFGNIDIPGGYRWNGKEIVTLGGQSAVHPSHPIFESLSIYLRQNPSKADVLEESLKKMWD